MKVFTDYHHDDLLYSLHLLLEKRLGWKLYRPIGLDWFNEGYWKVAEPYDNHPGTVAQYLVVGSIPENGTKPLNTNPKYADGKPHRLVTLDRFKEMQFDIVIASYLPHIEVFRKLIQKYQPKAKLIHQMGNDWSKWVDFGMVKNLLSSTAKFKTPTGVNAVFYHQEFDTKVFKYKPWKGKKKICSFTNALKDYKADRRLFLRYKDYMDDFEWKSYGSSNTDGIVFGHKNIAKEMHDSMFGWHLKTGGDGFGHIIHNWFACGRPVICKKQHYKGKLAGELMIDGRTCIFIDNLTRKDGSKKIRRYMDREKHEKLCRNAYRRFKSKVDFDEEEQKIRKFLENLV